MNRKLLALFLVLSGYLFFGCATSNATQSPLPLVNQDLIKDFDFVTLNAPGVMEISQGSVESLEILGDSTAVSSITASVTDRMLVISTENDLPTNSSITYKLIVTNLEGVLLDEFSVIKIPSFASDALELTVSGSGRMDLGDIKVANLKFIVNGNGSIEADSITSTSLIVSSTDAGSVTIAGGSTVDLMLELGSGLFLGADFKSTNVTLNMNGSGSAQVWSVEKLDVTINGDGKVIYFGEPTMSMSVSGGGQLSGGGNK